MNLVSLRWSLLEVILYQFHSVVYSTSTQIIFQPLERQFLYTYLGTYKQIFLILAFLQCENGFPDCRTPLINFTIPLW